MRDPVAQSDLCCPVCGTAMAPKRPAWWHVCPSCGMQTSTLEPVFDDRPMAEMFDWEQRNAAFAGLRAANANLLLDRLEGICPPPRRLLDVGCAEGWFLRKARERGYEVHGLEPDTRMAQTADKVLNIRAGFFPDALGQQERFDVITFNDVFEHLPDVRAAMAACAKLLTDEGVLVINLPNAHGGLYRISRLAARLGFAGPFERLWQAGYPSPHFSYFTPGTLGRLAQSARFVECDRFALPTVNRADLWDRIRYDRTQSLAYCVAAWTAVMSAMPLLAMMPSDIFVQMFRKDGAPSARGRRAAQAGNDRKAKRHRAS